MDFSDLSDFIEPFKIHIVENIKINNRNDRLIALEKADYNIFKLQPEDVMIDFLTDAGTNAFSLEQNARIWMGDESYAGSTSYETLKDTATYISGFENILPVFSECISEEIVASYFTKAGDKVIGNTFTYSLEKHIKDLHAEAISLLDWSDNNFAGNLDVQALKNLLAENDKKSISFLIMNVPAKSSGGQPVSMSNMKAVSDLCREHSIPIYIESSMYGENCWLNKMYEEAYFNKSLVEISQEMFSFFDGCIISAKRDGRSEIGSVICLQDKEMTRKLGTVITLKAGFITYGGMAGRDMEIVAVGMRDALDEQLQDYRQKQLAFFKKSLKEFGVPIVEPVGCNTIFIDAENAFPNCKHAFYPAWSLSCAVYIVGGIRCAEFGQVTRPTSSLPTNHFLKDRELLKLEIPRFIYTTCHIFYVAYVFAQLISHEMLSGMKRIACSEDQIKIVKIKMKPNHSLEYDDIQLLPVQDCEHNHFFKNISNQRVMKRNSIAEASSIWSVDIPS